MQGIDHLPDEITDLLNLATKYPPVAKKVLSYGMLGLGVLVVLLAITCLIRSSHRQSTLHLEGSSYLAAMHNNAANPEKSKTGEVTNPGFEMGNK